MIVFAGPSLLTLGTLGGAVLLKCGVFAFLERDLKRSEAFCYLFAGNVYSTSLGLLILIFPMMPILGLGLFAMVFFVSLRPARRIIDFSGWGWAVNRSPYQIAGMMTLLALFSLLLFIAAVSALESRLLALYWPLKVGYILCGLGIGIGLTSLWEEQVVGGLAARNRPTRGYFTSVIRANYITFGVALLIGAIRIFPERLKARDFLVWLWKATGLS